MNLFQDWEQVDLKKISLNVQQKVKGEVWGLKAINTQILKIELILQCPHQILMSIIIGIVIVWFGLWQV